MSRPFGGSASGRIYHVQPNNPCLSTSAPDSATTTSPPSAGRGDGSGLSGDTKLNQVALKILPEAFATDPDRLARFQREAQVLASLNHPGIAAIYGIEEQGDTRIG